MSAPLARPFLRQTINPVQPVGGGMPFGGQQPMPQQPMQQPVMTAGQPSMTGGQSSFPNPMQNPLAMLAAAKLEHSSMIIKGLLKHLDKSNVDVNANSR